MEEEAIKAGAGKDNPYAALAKLFKAHFYYDLSMRVGDIPLTASIKGLQDLAPKYDSQKSVMIQVLAWLSEANQDLKNLINNNNNQLTGDFYYGNKLSAWRKAVNVQALRVLLQLSKKSADSDLGIQNKITAILANPAEYPLFESNADNLQYQFNNSFNKYPVNPDNYGFDATRYNMAATYLNNLVALKDPRTFVTAEPTPKSLAAGKQPSDYTAYNGASSGEDLALMSSKANSGEYSFYNRRRYYTSYTAEPYILLGYAEMCFNIAEAINRGFAPGSSEDWYVKGIQASHSFYGIINGNNTFYYQKPGGSNTDNIAYTANFDWNSYYTQAAVKYAGNNATGLSQILLQKYLAFYQNSGYEAYYNWRRTGVPTFLTGPGTANSERIPKRFSYPTGGTGEINTNEENVKAAIQAQFGGTDDINAEMWIIK